MEQFITVWNTFKGRNNNDARDLQEKHNITEVVVPANTYFTNLLMYQLIVAVKYFASEKFQGWYAGKVEKDINVGQNTSDIAVEMGIPVMRELTSRWLIDVINQYMQKNQQSSRMDGKNVASQTP